MLRHDPQVTIRLPDPNLGFDDVDTVITLHISLVDNLINIILSFFQ